MVLVHATCRCIYIICFNNFDVFFVVVIDEFVVMFDTGKFKHFVVLEVTS